jgi:hypothetical protein
LEGSLTEQINKAVGTLTVTVNKNAESIRTLNEKVEIIAKSTSKEATRAIVEEVIEARQQFAPAESLTSGEIQSWQAKDEGGYLRARRAIRLWPVPGKTEDELWDATGNFIRKILEVDDVGPQDILSVRRISAGRRSRARDLVLVRFHDVTARDSVYRNATKLAKHIDRSGLPTAGLMLEIPENLLGAFRILQRHGHRLRERYGPEFKRHIRLCDEDKDVKLDVRFPGETEWQCVTSELAKQIDMEERNRGHRQLRDRLSHSSTGSATNSEPVSPSTQLSDEVFVTGANAQALPSARWGDWRKSNKN